MSYENFTDRARRSLALANEEACCLGHEYIGAEHLLLGLVADGAVAAVVLKNLKADTRQLRREVEKIIHVPTPRSAEVANRQQKANMVASHQRDEAAHLRTLGKKLTKLRDAFIQRWPRL